MKFKEYGDYDAVALADLIRRKEVSAQDVLDTAIAHCEAENPALNAVTHKMYDEARAQLVQADPAAPLYGVPFLVKDLSINYAGVPTTQGSRFFQDYVPQYDSELVIRYKKAGLIIIGKTNTPEFGSNWVTESVLLGACRNPYDLSRTPGGSSGGAAAAVAARITPVAHASDGGGSIRVPASCCGLIGLKPTRARTPVGPDRGESVSGLSVQHALTRSIRDSALLLDCTKGFEIGDPYAAPAAPESYVHAMRAPLPTRLKIAMVRQAPGNYPVAADCLRAVHNAAKQCEALGAVIIEETLTMDNEALKLATHTLWCAQLANTLHRYAQFIGRAYTKEDVEEANFFMAKCGVKFTARDYAQALDVIHHTGRQMGQFMQQYDLILTPTLAQLPVKVGELTYDPLHGSVTDFYKQKAFPFAPFTSLFNVTGQPAISLPLHVSAEGLPVGVQFAAAFGNELLLLQLGEVLLGDKR